MVVVVVGAEGTRRSKRCTFWFGRNANALVLNKLGVLAMYVKEGLLLFGHAWK